MKFSIKHEIPGRIRIHLDRKRLSFREADILQYYLANLPGVRKAKVYERTADAAVCFSCARNELILLIRRFRFENTQVPDQVLENSPRELNAYYRDRLIARIMIRYAKKLLLPAPVRAVFTAVNAARFILKGIDSLIHRRMDVAVLDATAIGVSVIRGDFETASSVMFLLRIGEIMEEWTHKKSVNDLARSMSLNIENVWLRTGGTEVLTPADQIREHDEIVVRTGNVIPFDGIVLSGEGMVNQASMTGEPLPVRKTVGGYVYAGTVLEEGEIVVDAHCGSGGSKYERIVSVIEETEKLKSATESRTEHLADRLVPWTLLGTGLVWLITRNITKTLSVLMVDFSCALKLSMPVTVLSAIREAGSHHITIKGGKFIEAVAAAETLVFDKTGTLTKACPTVQKVVSLCGEEEDELLRVAACLEEHYPHSMARAIVTAAAQKGLIHEEMHTKIEYVVAHGIASYVMDKKVLIGSAHFVFEDEKCRITKKQQKIIDGIPGKYSRLYMAVDGRIAAVICVEDPVREDAKDAIRKLKEAGFKKIVMMTGDSYDTAASVAAELGMDEFYAEVLPEHKAAFVQQEKEKGRKVVMVGDGINDSQALSAADAGIAISDGAQIAREIADITISGEELENVVVLKQLSNAMMKRINRNYRLIMGINGTLIALGVGGILSPAVSATLHNLSTIAISVSGMTKLLAENN